VADRECGDLNGDLSNDERLRTVGEELVEEGEEGAGEETQEPHPEGPYGSGRIVCVGDRETNLFDWRNVVVFFVWHLVRDRLLWVRNGGHG